MIIMTLVIYILKENAIEFLLIIYIRFRSYKLYPNTIFDIQVRRIYSLWSFHTIPIQFVT